MQSSHEGSWDYHPGELKVLLGKWLFGRFSATFAGSLLTNVSARKDLILFAEVIEDFDLYDNYPMQCRPPFKNFSKCFRKIRVIRIHV